MILCAVSSWIPFSWNILTPFIPIHSGNNQICSNPQNQSKYEAGVSATTASNVKSESIQGTTTSQTRKKSKHSHSISHSLQSPHDEHRIKRHRHNSRSESFTSRRQQSRSPSPHLDSLHSAPHDSLHPEEVSQGPTATTDSEDPKSVQEPEPEALPYPLESLPKEYSPDYTLAFQLDEQPREELRTRLSKLLDRFAGIHIFIYHVIFSHCVYPAYYWRQSFIS